MPEQVSAAERKEAVRNLLLATVSESYARADHPRRRVSRLPRHAGRASRVVSVGVVTVIALGGGAAAAVTVDSWRWWDQYQSRQPDGTFTYTLPSRAVCEGIFTLDRSADPAVVAIVQNYLASVNVAEVADQDGALAEVSEVRAAQDPAASGGQRDASGMWLSPTDALYKDTIHVAVHNAVSGELDRHGYDDAYRTATGLAYESSARCALPAR